MSIRNLRIHIYLLRVVLAVVLFFRRMLSPFNTVASRDLNRNAKVAGDVLKTTIGNVFVRSRRARKIVDDTASRMLMCFRF